MAAKVVRGREHPPLYVQIADLLRARIAESLQPGDRLDSEPSLVRELAVSRATVIKALDLLASEGLVRREQGRGTFVATPRFERMLPELTGFSEHITALGHTPGQQLLGHDRLRSHHHDDLLSGFPEATDVVVVRRLRLVDGVPVGLHRLAVPGDVADAIGLRQALDQPSASVYRLLDRHGVVLHEAREHLWASEAHADEAGLLGVEVGTPLMHVRRLSSDVHGRLVEAVDARYLGALYDYRIRLVRTGAATKEQAHDLDPTIGPAAALPDAGGRLRLRRVDHE